MSDIESRVQTALALGVGAGAAAVAWGNTIALAEHHGMHGWRAWVVAACIETGAVSAGLEIRRRRRREQPAAPAVVFLVVVVLLQLATQVARAEMTVWGVLLSAVPAVMFLALVKVALGALKDDRKRTRAKPSASPQVKPSAPKVQTSASVSALDPAPLPATAPATVPLPLHSVAPQEHPESTPGAPRGARTDDELVEQVRALDGHVSARRIARELNIGQARAARVLAAAQGEPAA